MTMRMVVIKARKRAAEGREHGMDGTVRGRDLRYTL